MKSFFKNIIGLNNHVDDSAFIPPVFLTGCMRSGTTFFAKVLSEHPKIFHLKGELGEEWTKLGGIDCVNNRKYANRNDISDISASNMVAYFERCRLHYSTSNTIIQNIIDRYKTGSGGYRLNKNSYLLNKSVHFINRTDYILNLIPNSKVILIIRPMEAQVASIKIHFEKNALKNWYYSFPKNKKDSWISSNNKLENNWNIEQLAHKWIDLNITAIEDLRKNSSNNSFIVNYNSLIKSPREVLKRVFALLNISDEPTKFQGEASKTRKVFNSNTDGNPLTAWESILTSKDKEVINAVKKQRATELNIIEESFQI